MRWKKCPQNEQKKRNDTIWEHVADFDPAHEECESVQNIMFIINTWIWKNEMTLTKIMNEGTIVLTYENSQLFYLFRSRNYLWYLYTNIMNTMNMKLHDIKLVRSTLRTIRNITNNRDVPKTAEKSK